MDDGTHLMYRATFTERVKSHRRCDDTAEFVRAYELRLYDWIIVRALGKPRVDQVRSVEIVGDDVIVNGHITTSVGNTFLRIGEIGEIR